MLDPRLRDKYWRITHLYKIINKDGKSQRFTLNTEQEALFKLYQDKKKSQGLRERILKDRQIGITTFHCIYYLDEVIFNRNRQAAIIAHRRDALERIFRVVKYAWQSMPPELRPQASMENKRELKLLEPNSSIYIELKVRSGTVHHLHVSEVAYIDNQKELKAGSFQSVPYNGDITLETTGNGINEFYTDWHSANTLWSNHFFSWLQHSAYKSSTHRTGKHEEYLSKIGATQEQKNWWYGKLEEIGFDVEIMKQEYPANSEEAFITSGKGIYNDELQDMGILKPIETPDDLYKDYLMIFEHPEEGAQYCLGADPSGGFSDGDNACFYIFNTKTHKPVMRWKGRLAPDLFGLEIKRWAEKYNEAFVGIEVNNHGLTTINTIKDDYSNMYKRERRDRVTNEITKELGWQTTEVSRREIIDRIRLYLREHNEIPESLMGELRTFVRKDNGKIEAEDGQHDDEVLAFGIGLMVTDSNPYFEFKKKERTYFGH